MVSIKLCVLSFCINVHIETAQAVKEFTYAYTPDRLLYISILFALYQLLQFEFMVIFLMHCGNVKWKLSVKVGNLTTWLSLFPRRGKLYELIKYNVNNQQKQDL